MLNIQSTCPYCNNLNDYKFLGEFLNVEPLIIGHNVVECSCCAQFFVLALSCRLAEEENKTMVTYVAENLKIQGCEVPQFLIDLYPEKYKNEDKSPELPPNIGSEIEAYLVSESGKKLIVKVVNEFAQKKKINFV